MDALALAEAVRRGRRSAAKLVDEALAKAEADGLGCFWELAVEPARAQARAIDASIAAGSEPGPLAGVPLAVKDSFDVRGLRTTLGVRTGEHAPAGDHAEAVSRLERAGAVVIGKAAMHQLGWGMSGQSPGFPPCRNPVDPSLMPGGSSSGSAAAVAAGITPLALGADAGGSVRQPAAWCGVVGFKPTRGSASIAGCAPMAPSFDTVGVIARSVRDCSAAWRALAPVRIPSTAAGSPPPSPGRPTRVGVLGSSFAGAAPLVERACRDALVRWARAGAELCELELCWERRLLGPLYAAELAACWAENVEASPAAYAPDVVAGIRDGQSVQAVDYVRALGRLDELRRRTQETTRDVDLLAGPTTPIVAPPLEKPDPTQIAGRNTRVFNGLDWPAISLPCQPEGELPIGLQLAAPPGCDAQLLAQAAALEQLLSTPPSPIRETG